MRWRTNSKLRSPWFGRPVRDCSRWVDSPELQADLLAAIDRQAATLDHLTHNLLKTARLDTGALHATAWGGRTVLRIDPRRHRRPGEYGRSRPVSGGGAATREEAPILADPGADSRLRSLKYSITQCGIPSRTLRWTFSLSRSQTCADPSSRSRSKGPVISCRRTAANPSSSDSIERLGTAAHFRPARAWGCRS